MHITYIAEQQDVDWPGWMNKLLCSFFSRNLVHRDPMGWKVSYASWAKRRLLGYFPKLQVSILSRRERESCPQSSFCSNRPWIWSQVSEDDFILKHCQRHNGPEGWVHLTKVTSWGHITSSNTNLDQISSSESTPQPNISISNKLKIQNLDQT